MGSASWQPKWWTEEKHGSAWATAKEALKRDWEQTKNDVGLGGKDLNQDVGDTVKQATGKEPVPAANTPNWEEAEQPLMYGFSARQQYGTQHNDWNDNLESTLRSDWETNQSGRKWDEVKGVVRHAYDRARR